MRKANPISERQHLKKVAHVFETPSKLAIACNHIKAFPQVIQLVVICGVLALLQVMPSVTGLRHGAARISRSQPSAYRNEVLESVIAAMCLGGSVGTNFSLPSQVPLIHRSAQTLALTALSRGPYRATDDPLCSSQVPH